MVPGLSKSIEGMRRGGYRKTHVSPHLAYGLEGVAGKIPADAVLLCEFWFATAAKTPALRELLFQLPVDAVEIEFLRVA